MTNGSTRGESRTVRTYCAQCYNNCPVVAHVEGGRLVRVSPDTDHPYHRPLCPKGVAGPELLYSPDRLDHPLRRTNPKTSHDPGWEEISWDEALQTVADRLLAIREEHGSEAVAFTQSFVATPLWEIQPYLRRLSNAFGSPNSVTTSHICNWHRDFGSAFTYAQPRAEFSAGWPEFEQSASILIWGCNTHATMPSLHGRIETAVGRGARLIAVDPRRTPLAESADVWLQVKPGTDGALALGMLHVLIEEDLYDDAFLRGWTNAPLLVRTDNGRLLAAEDVDGLDAEGGFVAVDSRSLEPVHVVLGEKIDRPLGVHGEHLVRLCDGSAIRCETVYELLHSAVRPYDPDRVEAITRVPASQIREAVELLTENRPASWYSYNGVEQSVNAVQTNRVLCILYALIGDYDVPGGNSIWRRPPLAYPYGIEFVKPEMVRKTLGIRQNPLGPSGTLMSVPAHAFYRAALEGMPYPVTGLVGFGGNLVTSNPDSLTARAALRNLKFQVQSDLFMTPTAELADIVLPAASFWEVARLGFLTDYLGKEYYLHWRPAVVPPCGERRDDLDVILDLGGRLGLGEHFWNGDTEAAQACQLSRLEVGLDEVKGASAGIRMSMEMGHRKYEQSGFKTLTGRVEIFSQPLLEIGQPPIPAWQDPAALYSKEGEFPLTLTNSKLRQFCQSQHRAISSLRRQSPHPFAEIHPVTAAESGVQDGDWIVVETNVGAVSVVARTTEDILTGVVCVQHGWWQACGELDLPGYDPYSEGGANANLLFDSAVRDPVSGSVHMKGVPCRVRRRNS